MRFFIGEGRLADTCEFVKRHLIGMDAANARRYIFQNDPVMLKRFLILPLLLVGLSAVAAPKQGDVRKLDLGKGVTLELVYIPPGKFMMGSKEISSDRVRESPEHEVHLQAFYIE